MADAKAKNLTYIILHTQQTRIFNSHTLINIRRSKNPELKFLDILCSQSLLVCKLHSSDLKIILKRFIKENSVNIRFDRKAFKKCYLFIF